MNRQNPRFSFWTKFGKVTIVCELEYARYLVNTGRVAFGTWEDFCNRVYL